MALRNIPVKLRIRLPLLLLITWMYVIGGLIWKKAHDSRLPPVGDDYSYIEEAQNSWINIRQGFPKSPLDVDPDLRPPGTVLISFPFGYDGDIAAYRFRTLYIPIVAWTIAILLVCWPMAGLRRTSEAWFATWAAVVFGANPFFFEFEYGMTEVHWGLMDQALGAFAGLSLALLIRGMGRRSMALVAAGVLSSTFCLLLKPAGSLVLLLTGIFFCAGELLRYMHERRKGSMPEAGFLIKGTLLFLLIGGGVSVLSLTSRYISQETIQVSLFAQDVLKWMDSRRRTVDILLSHYIYVGLQGILLMALTLAAAYRMGGNGRMLPGAKLFFAGILLLAAGILSCKYLLGVSTIRYFSPFAFMAIVALVAWLASLRKDMGSAYPSIAWQSMGLLTALNTGALAAHPAPPRLWESLSGVNTSLSRPLPREIVMGRWINDICRSWEQETVLYINHPDCAPEWFSALSMHIRGMRGDSTTGYREQYLNIWLEKPVIDLRKLVGEADLILNKAGPANPNPRMPEFAPISDFIWGEALAGRIQVIRRMGDMALLRIPNKGSFLSRFNDAFSRERWSEAFIRVNRVSAGRVFPWDTLSPGNAIREGQPGTGACRHALEHSSMQPLKGDTLESGELLCMQGWLAEDVAKGLNGEDVLVTMESPGRPVRFGRTLRYSRPDVVDYFGKPGLRQTGFRCMLNLSAWEGYSTLGLAYVRNGKWHRVPQSRRTLRYSAVHSDGFRISVPYPRMPAFATADAGEGQGLAAYHVERLDGAPCESRDTLRIDGVLAFEGWLAADTLAGRTADSVCAILERAGEPVLSAPLVGRSRSDVSAYFQKAGLLRSGFHGQVDMRGLQGKYRLGMAYLADGRWHRLPGFQKIVIVGKME